MGSVSYDFTGDVVLITGAARGLGRDFALSFARAGARVAVNDLAGATSAMASLRDRHGRRPRQGRWPTRRRSGPRCSRCPAT